MLFDYLTDYPPAFRVLVWNEKHEHNKELYSCIVEILKENKIDVVFERVPGWSVWRGVLKSKDPDFVFDEPHDYSDKFAQWAFEVFKENYEKVNGVLMNNIDRIKRVQKVEKSD